MYLYTGSKVKENISNQSRHRGVNSTLDKFRKTDNIRRLKERCDICLSKELVFCYNLGKEFMCRLQKWEGELRAERSKIKSRCHGQMAEMVESRKDIKEVIKKITSDTGFSVIKVSTSWIVKDNYLKNTIVLYLYWEQVVTVGYTLR